MNKYLIIILIIIGSSNIICFDLTNVTIQDTFPVCPVKLFRRKRALEYTRWKANQDTTQEFLVKVLDDELTTPNAKQIVAVNIQPVTKVGEKIIVGGVIIPPTTTLPIVPEVPRDYTRFVPPTTVPVSRVDDELFLAPQAQPKPFDQVSPIKPKVQIPAARNSQRDESPPASPQFIARTPALMARQFAPIAPVAFTQRSPITPRKLVSTQVHHTSTDFSWPTRTTEHPEFMWPTRTRPDTDDYKELHSFEQNLVDEFSVSRSTFESNLYPQRTSTIKTHINVEDPVIAIHTERNQEYIRKFLSDALINNNIQAKSSDKETDNIYSMTFYGDEESDNNKSQDVSDIYEEKAKQNLDVDTTSEKEANELDDYNTVNTTTQEFVKEYEYSDENISRNTTKRRFGANSEVTVVNLTNNQNRDKHRQSCNLLKLRPPSFNTIHTLPEIVSQMKQWAEKSPLVKWEDITGGNLTTLENPIYLIVVDDPSSGQILSAKQTVMIVAGIQGRDHHAVAAAMYVLYQLIERSDSHRDLLTKYRFWVIPVFNPDGYDYSMTFPHRREWSKNLRQNWEGCKTREQCTACENYGLRCIVQPCYGVNLDRNFEYQWIPTEELQSEHPCGALYAGARQLSETETRALTHFLHEKRTPLYTFIAFKEGEVLGIMYPYSHTRKLRAFDHVYRQRASRAASAAYSISGRPYVAGQTSEFLPLYAGGIEDWIDGHLGIDNTYTIMMFRPTDSYNSKLITERVVHEAYAAMDTLLLQSVEPLGPPSITLKRANDSSKESPCWFLITFFVLLHRFTALK